ncbi:hypothetical protein EMIHUDRAFT_95428 [Emiliania huxleyi CCMP1516]|uniref:Nucleotide-diphospho-sugar transferase domain-containing protein n=2 Tax=Emiliania huxleyi TaxID=2903 RepID=A0A0D3JH17_EMIH1|nr:hypothetical protein EMIHUDRAFT_95428 [Emiliania huxleyi CCMP1516]EOD22802.1 hypothetical protein EMIHUDRAFT_95428 [Emiliania huxleyi CCMP1516]|eukprot:XP_005775231.1 hypothetical protein EMIHUDRAFT_95428 [Emiliania huxleyi CCMP1516]
MLQRELTPRSERKVRLSAVVTQAAKITGQPERWGELDGAPHVALVEAAERELRRAEREEGGEEAAARRQRRDAADAAGRTPHHGQPARLAMLLDGLALDGSASAIASPRRRPWGLLRASWGVHAGRREGDDPLYRCLAEGSLPTAETPDLVRAEAEAAERRATRRSEELAAARREIEDAVRAEAEARASLLAAEKAAAEREAAAAAAAAAAEKRRAEAERADFAPVIELRSFPRVRMPPPEVLELQSLPSVWAPVTSGLTPPRFPFMPVSTRLPDLEIPDFVHAAHLQDVLDDLLKLCALARVSAPPLPSPPAPSEDVLAPAQATPDQLAGMAVADWICGEPPPAAPPQATSVEEDAEAEPEGQAEEAEAAAAPSDLEIWAATKLEARARGRTARAEAARRRASRGPPSVAEAHAEPEADAPGAEAVHVGAAATRVGAVYRGRAPLLASPRVQTALLALWSLLGHAASERLRLLRSHAALEREGQEAAVQEWVATALEMLQTARAQLDPAPPEAAGQEAEVRASQHNAAEERLEEIVRVLQKHGWALPGKHAAHPYVNLAEAARAARALRAGDESSRDSHCMFMTGGSGHDLNASRCLARQLRQFGSRWPFVVAVLEDDVSAARQALPLSEGVDGIVTWSRFPYQYRMSRILRPGHPLSLGRWSRSRVLDKLNLLALPGGAAQRIVWIDPDVHIRRNVDELCLLNDSFAAAPNIGIHRTCWRMVNTGVLSVRPLTGSHFRSAVLQPIVAGKVPSREGSDQGAINSLLYGYSGTAPLWGTARMLPERYNFLARRLHTSLRRWAATPALHFSGETKKMLTSSGVQGSSNLPSKRPLVEALLKWRETCVAPSQTFSMAMPASDAAVQQHLESLIMDSTSLGLGHRGKDVRMYAAWTRQ